MSMNNKRVSAFVSLMMSMAIPAIAAATLSSCDSGENAGESAGTTSTDPATNEQSKQTTGTQSSQLVTPACTSGDANHLCLAVHFVSYKDSNGTPVASVDQVKTIMGTMNRVWAQCNIGFQVENYEAVDPSQKGLDFGSNSQNQLEQIRTTFKSPENMLLAVNTGPWGTSVNAWTNMPGEGVYGAIMEQSIVDYGGGMIHAHEFGHYLGLDHVSDTSDLMNPVIYTDSTKLTSDQCATARDTVNQFWSAMIRK